MASFVSRLIVIATAFTGLASCSTTLGRAADSWIGAPVDEFVVIAGAPRRQFELQDGRVAYTWILNCEVTFVAREGVFQSWSSTNCARIQPVPGKWMRSVP
jgi:hypothetical protein